MRIIYNNDNEEALDALLQRDGTLKIHMKNLRKLMVEVYKTTNHLNPPFMWDIFANKGVEYDFRITILCELPPAKSQKFGTNSLTFKDSLFWSSLSDEIKTAKSLIIYKKIGEWNSFHVQHAETNYLHTYFTLFYFTSSLLSCKLSMLVLLSLYN